MLRFGMSGISRTRLLSDVYGPDATIALDFCPAPRSLAWLRSLLVYPEAMQANLDQLGGLVHSQQVLLALHRLASAVKTPIASSSATR